MANVILSPELSFLDFRRKFGTWVKPPRVAASAPLRMMLRSLRISPMWRSDWKSIRTIIARPRAVRPVIPFPAGLADATGFDAGPPPELLATARAFAVGH